MAGHRSTRDFVFDVVSGPPLYRQLADFMRERIDQGVWAGGDELPSEHELCKANGLSRTTVRLAFGELINDGRIIRKRGKGSFVAEPKLRRTLNNLYSFTDDMIDSGRVPTSRVLESDVREAGTEIANELVIGKSDLVFFLKRIREADGRPMILDTSCVPHSLCAGIESEDFSARSLYAHLADRYSIIPYRAIETHEVISIPHAVAEMLGAEALSPAFLITRLAYLEDGTVFEYTQSVTPGDRCRFEIGLNGPRRGITLQRGYRTHV